MLTPLRAWRRVAALGVLLASSGMPALAQTPFVPYFGKNEVRYDNFKWQIYTTDHFEVYYYPETEEHLERIAGYAESAYQKISSELKHDLAFKVPLLIFKTQSEFQQQNVIPGAVSEGVAAFAEPSRNRMLVPIDEPPDQLYRLITHELTHIFEFDIIPRSLVRRTVPLWVDEGLADYMAGVWNPLDLMTVRDAAVADIIPKMSKMEGYGASGPSRLVYNLGHACFEFVEARWGKEGIRQFLFALRKSVIGGGDAAFEEAFRVTADEFDQQFDKYMKDRFKAFRDKERPADYGRNLAPDRRESKFTAILSVEPSPSGDLLAAVAGNRKEGEVDIILLSTKDRSVVRNLTPGFSKDKGFEYIALPGARWIRVPWLAWSPVGDRLAYFVRTEKQRSLILQNVVSGKIEKRFYLADVDVPESPEFSLDGRKVYFSALRNAVGDIFELDIETGDIRNLTSDAFADYAPTISPDGTSLIYLARISGNDKLFRLDLASGTKTQLTFGTHDEGAAQFLAPTLIVFPSTAVDPAAPVDPEVVRNGQIFNLWTLDLKTGALAQYTDTLTGIFSPMPLAGGEERRVAFVTPYKDEYEVHLLPLKEPLLAAASSDFGEAAPVIDFQAPLTHTLIPANNRVKGRFEKMFLDGRPPINVGVTSGGDLFGGTAISFSDVLGDQNFTFFAASVAQYRTFAGSYSNLSHRTQFAIQAYSQTQFYYGLMPGLYDPSLTYFLRRDDAIATRSINGASVFAIYPFNRYTRVELSGGVSHYSDQFRDQSLQDYSDAYQQALYGGSLFNNGTAVPLTVALTRETTVFREYGPLAGHTFRLAYTVAPKIGNTLARQTFDADARYYQRIATNGVAAFRIRGFHSDGDVPDYFFFGGNSELRGYDYLEFLGNKGFFANAELRFPLIEAMLTPIGVMGGVRAVLFAGVGGASLFGRPSSASFSGDTASTSYQFASSADEVVRPIVGFQADPTNPESGIPVPVYGDPRVISGFRLKDGRASYGLGLETFLLGFPIHFDWSWRTLFNKEWEDIAFAFNGGSAGFRKSRFKVWIGYDF
ncbi:MAG: PD40 domain-containing protein [Acidobacteria bacterium]|nr:PD40 domain-containing protein [Acidobacteriota bacterium]